MGWDLWIVELWLCEHVSGAGLHPARTRSLGRGGEQPGALMRVTYTDDTPKTSHPPHSAGNDQARTAWPLPALRMIDQTERRTVLVNDLKSLGKLPRRMEI